MFILYSKAEALNRDKSGKDCALTLVPTPQATSGLTLNLNIDNFTAPISTNRSHEEKMFQNANNFVINGGQFTGIGNNHDAVSTTLLQHVAAGAMFDSAERYPPGKCHPGTRQRMIDQITAWIEDTNTPQSILWLYGSAGSGKSALMQSMCERLRKSHPEMYAGSFFFARGHKDRGKGTKLFVTLSYQLAVQFASVRAEINNTLYHDPILPTKSIDIQLLSLIINPLSQCTGFPTQRPIIIIDGLDECDDDQGLETQQEIIALISKSIVEHDIPLRFIIASRPEYWIRDAFETSSLSDITFSLSLRDDYHADRDIRVYLTEEFDKIRLENQRVMRSVVLPWPPENTIERLVKEASGQYIYASTVLKFVGKGSRFSDPQSQLRTIMYPGPHRASAFSELDRLYATILSAYPQWETMKSVLGGLLVGVNLTGIEVMLGVERTQITLVMDALSSLINIHPPEPLSEDELLLEPIFGSLLAGQERISFCHLTFREFLENETRSGTYYINIDTIKAEIAHAFFGIIHRNLEQNYETEPHVLFNIGLSTYNGMMRALFADVKLDCDVGTLLPLITDMTERLRRLDPDRRMNHPACFMQDMAWINRMLFVTQRRYEDVVYSTKHQPNDFLLHSFLDALHQLRDIASLARRSAIRLLSLCDGFRITPTLAFIDFFPTPYNMPIKKLLGNTIPGINAADIFSTFQQHRHIIEVSQSSRPRLVDLDKSKIDEGWLSRAEWRNQRVFLVCECLKSIMNNLDNDWERFMGSNMKRLVLGEFFDNGDMSDIHGMDYFENPYNLSFLSLMADAVAWATVLPSRPELWKHLGSLISPVLCWFNRQLTNLHTLRLMEGHDTSLPQKMKTTMITIFQLCFVPIFTTRYFSELRISTVPNSMLYSSREPHYESIRIRMLPMSYWDESDIVYSPPENHDATSFHRVHDEIFGMQSLAPVGHNIIKPSLWYPHLAAYLLNVLVKYLYTQTFWAFGGCGHGNIVKQSFPYILECLPYAEASQQNLDALRAIKYFSPQTTPYWQPTEGFCSLCLEFLTKYEHSVLSPEEFDNFELWLSNLKEFERNHGDYAM